MSCKFCGRLFSRGFNLRRHENEYCPLRNQNISNSQESDIDHSLHMDRKRKHTESDDSVSPSSDDDQASNTPESTETDYETESEPEDERDPPKKARHAESDDDDVSISSHDESSENGETDDDGDESSEKGETDDDDGEDEFDPWEELIDIAKEKVNAEYEELLQEFRSEGFDEQDAITKAAEQISPRLREELQKTYLKRMVWMNELKKDETHRKIMKTRKAFIDEDDFDPGEALAAAIEKRKFLFGKLLHESRCPNSDEDSN